MVETPARKFLRAATPIVAAVFVVSAATGTLLFFHVGERLIKELHEWIGLAFVVAAALHIARNGRALLGHGRKPGLWIAVALALATAAAFIVPAAMAASRNSSRERRASTSSTVRAYSKRTANRTMASVRPPPSSRSAPGKDHTKSRSPP